MVNMTGRLYSLNLLYGSSVLVGLQLTPMHMTVTWGGGKILCLVILLIGRQNARVQRSLNTAKELQPLPSQMPLQPSAHSLAGQNSQHRGSAAGKSPQHHYHCTQLRWAGHVSRMHDDRIPKQLFYGELCHGKRTVGGQRKRFKDSLKVSLKDFHISTESWESLASDRPCWRRIVTQGAITAEEHRTLEAEQKSAAGKAKTTSTASTPTHHCPTCGKSFLTRIGLISHLRTHRDSPTDWLCSWSSSTTIDEQHHRYYSARTQWSTITSLLIDWPINLVGIVSSRLEVLWVKWCPGCSIICFHFRCSSCSILVLFFATPLYLTWLILSMYVLWLQVLLTSMNKGKSCDKFTTVISEWVCECSLQNPLSQIDKPLEFVSLLYFSLHWGWYHVFCQEMCLFYWGFPIQQRATYLSQNATWIHLPGENLFLLFEDENAAQRAFRTSTNVIRGEGCWWVMVILRIPWTPL